jgi:succinate dehydrogenase / fumarate reductase cytochrome b subunit
MSQKNRLGIWGWLGGGRYGVERYAYALHRLTGIGLLFYFILHILVTGSRIGGPENWQATMARFETPLFKFGEYLIFIAFAFHALNGLRLVFTELGVALGKAHRPVYPYVNSINRQRPLLIILMVIAVVLIVVGGIDFYLL